MKFIYTILVLILLPVSVSFAHVELDYPVGGEQFRQGEMVVLQWHVKVAHPLVDWDIWYSLTGPEGPWYDLVIDLPGGDSTQDSQHQYTWVVPEIESDSVRIRIRQDNSDFDWEYINYYDISILAESCCYGTRGNMKEGAESTPDIADLVTYVAWSFNSGSPPYCFQEANIDGSSNNQVDIYDLVYLVEYLFNNGPAPSSCP